MARVTVEDCLKFVKNRFELVIVASKRARQLMRGKEPKVDWDNDKSTVVALREIAEGYVDFDSNPNKDANAEESHPIPAKTPEITPKEASAATTPPPAETAPSPAPEASTPKTAQEE